MERDAYFEWTYTQFIAENIFVNVIIHRTDMFGLTMRPYASLSYYTHDGEHGHFRLPENTLPFFRALHKAAIQVQISVGPIEIDGVIVFNARNVIEESLAEHTEEVNSQWFVTIPHGNFQGAISFRNKALAEHASVYQDHQFGKLPVQNFLKKWGWGVTVENDTTHCIFSIQPKGGTGYTIVFRCDGMTLEKRRLAYNQSWVESLDGGARGGVVFSEALKADVDFDRPLRARVQERYQNFSFTYYRYICRRGNAICGVCEYMEIGEGGS